MTKDEKNVAVAQEASTGKCYLPARFVLAFLLFWAMCLDYAHRVCISVTIVVMVNYTALSQPNTMTEEDETCPIPQTFDEMEHRKEGSYLWSQSIQGVILGAYFYGYVCTQIVGGRLAELVGGKWPLGLSILIGSLLTLITPLAADVGVGALVVVRATMGLAHGICLPTAFAILAHWAPVEERNTLLSLCFIGDHVGTVLAMPLAGYLSDSDFLGGWPSVFYILGLLGCIWFAFWAFLAYNKPSDHPRISREEIDYIQKDHTQMLEDQKLPVPWSKVLRSMPVWAVAIAAFCVGWGSSTLHTKLPTYMELVQHMPIKLNSLVNSWINLCSCITLFFSGYLSDYLRIQKGFSPTKVRKGFQLIAMVGPAISTALIPTVGCQTTHAIILLTFAMTFLGMTAGGHSSIVADMAPHHAATIFGLTNAIGSTAPIFSPLIAGLILDNAHASIDQWSSVFYLSAIIYLIGGLVFLIWASGEKQSWAYIPQKDQFLILPANEKDPMIFITKQNGLKKSIKYGTIPELPKT